MGFHLSVLELIWVFLVASGGGGGWYFLAVSDGLIMYIYLIFICILYVHHRQADSL